MTDPGGTPALRVTVADDHPIVLEGLRAVLAAAPDMLLVGTARDGKEAVALTLDQRPDVVVMDLGLPGLDGAGATRQITDACPEVAVLVLTMHDDDESLFAAVRSGARGYLLKGATNDQITDAIRAVARGEALFGAPVAQRLLANVAGAAPAPLPELSSREREILEQLVAGRGTNEIARTLFLSPKTVRNHISSVLSKLHATDRVQAVVIARDAGLTEGRNP
ncbi:response regulator transcription factor [Luedemannella flava]|uniref:Response regulator transcription factor n=1 Tax=Luedemannella flava TaxID=349316 RepID=A0ABP4XGQ1_9ACTN